MPFTLVQCRDAQEWDEFVGSSPQGSVFCSTAFLSALEAERELWFVAEAGRPVLGAVILRQAGRPLPAPYPFAPYLGVLIGARYAELPSHSRFAAVLRGLDFLLAELEVRSELISFCLHPAFEDLRGFSWFHYHQPERGRFRIELRYTGMLEASALADWEAYLESIRRLRQREYRKACVGGLVVEKSQDVGTLERLHQLTFERQGIAVPEREARLLRRISCAALQHGFGELLVCRNAGGETLAATLFLYDARCGYSLFGATDPQQRDTGAYTFLILENLLRCRERGVARVDFVGVNSPNRGDYKLSFNFKPVPYFVATWQKPLATRIEEAVAR